jgi:exoribonuclease II
MDNHELLNIAREAMRQRGLQPDFSAAAQQEAALMTEPIAPTDAALPDLRDLLWCSIDNDDSRDLDQLTVALPQANGVQRILVAIATRMRWFAPAARSTTMRARTRPRCTRPPACSRCCRCACPPT